MICAGASEYYFSKEYDTYPGSPFKDVISVRYFRCAECGFTFSATHQDMSKEEWSSLNVSWHHHFEGDHNSRNINQPPYAAQALVLSMLEVNGVIDLDDALDYAAGYGTLSRFMKKYFSRNICIFDKYVTSGDQTLTYLSEANLGHYSLVMNSAMFEHVIDRDSLDSVNHLVSTRGVLMLHTVVCENIPKDPSWFYLNPIVHSAFHTNESMRRLMEQWGYSASIYCPMAKSWFLFKDGHPAVAALEEKVEAINQETQSNFLVYKRGFVDYWKGF